MPGPDALQPAKPRTVGSQPRRCSASRTACRFALRDQARNRLAGVLLVVLVPAWYLLLGVFAGHQELAFRLFATGRILTVDGRDLTLISAGLNSLTIIVGFTVFVAIRRELPFDKRSPRPAWWATVVGDGIASCHGKHACHHLPSCWPRRRRRTTIAARSLIWW